MAVVFEWFSGDEKKRDRRARSCETSYDRSLDLLGRGLERDFREIQGFTNVGCINYRIQEQGRRLGGGSLASSVDSR